MASHLPVSWNQKYLKGATSTAMKLPCTKFYPSASTIHGGEHVQYGTIHPYWSWTISENQEVTFPDNHGGLSHHRMTVQPEKYPPFHPLLPLYTWCACAVRNHKSILVLSPEENKAAFLPNFSYGELLYLRVDVQSGKD